MMRESTISVQNSLVLYSIFLFILLNQSSCGEQFARMLNVGRFCTQTKNPHFGIKSLPATPQPFASLHLEMIKLHVPPTPAAATFAVKTCHCHCQHDDLFGYSKFNEEGPAPILSIWTIPQTCSEPHLHAKWTSNKAPVEYWTFTSQPVTVTVTVTGKWLIKS
jgi:hypothetical protein